MDALLETIARDAKKHPGLTLARRTRVTGVIFGVAGVLLVTVAPAASLLAWPLAILYVALGTNLRRTALANGPQCRALDFISRGDGARAESVLALIDKRSTRMSERSLMNSRALVSLDAGDEKGAIEQASRAIALRPSVLEADLAYLQIAYATSLRALARALAHQNDEAMADVVKATDDRFASGETYANLELARAIVAANEDRKSDVLAALARTRAFLDAPSARTRKLMRALDTYARDTKRSVYRHAAKPDEHPTDAWAATEQRTLATFPETNAARVSKATNKRVRVFVLWLALLMVFLAVWQRVSPPHAPIDPGWTANGMTALFFGGLLSASVAAMVVAVRARMRRRAYCVGAARGDAAARKELERLATKRSPEACFDVARLEERAGNFEAALARCDAGLAAANASPNSQAMSFDVVAPALCSERAFCLAALGREKESEAALAAITNANYSGASMARFRVWFANALIRGDREGAREIARTYGQTLSLPLRDAFLIDQLEAKSDEDWSRIHATVRDDPALEKWGRHFLPSQTITGALRAAVPTEDDEAPEEDEAHRRENAKRMRH